MNRFFLLPALLLAVSASVALSQDAAPEAPATPVKPFTAEEAAKMAERFTALQKEFDSKQKDILNVALGRYSTAAASEAGAVQLYFECQRMIEERKPDLDGPDTKREAKDKADKTKHQVDSVQDTPGYGSVLQLQAQFLVLSIEAVKAKDTGALIGRLRDFSNQAVKLVQTYTAPPEPEHKPAASVKSSAKREAEKKREARGDEKQRHQVLQLAQRGVMSSPFAQAFNLSSYFKPVQNWPQGPLDLDGIYGNMILPWYRENKPELLGSQWDEFIRDQAVLERCGSDDNAYAKWLIGAYKTLNWKKWRDLLDHGTNRMMAIDELVKMCKENPTHPAVSGWVQELAAIGENMKKAAGVPETETAAKP